MTTEPMDSRPGGNRTTLLLYWGAFVFVCALFNFVCGLIMEEIYSELFYIVFNSVAGAQIAIHALWTVFAPVAPLKQFFVAIVSGFIGVGAFILGSFTRDYLRYGEDCFERLIRNGDEIAAMFLVLPLVAVVGYASLWVARYFFRWKVVHTADSEASKLSSPLQIRHMMIATGVVAVALSAGRLASDFIGDEYFSIGIAIITLSIAGVGLFTVLPITAVILWMRRPFHGLLILLATYAGFLAFFILALVIFSGMPFDAEIIFYLFVLVVSYSGPITAFLFAVRALGYRLQWGHSTRWKNKGGQASTEPV